MTKVNSSITSTEQALAQLRATRAAGHYIDWDSKKDVPDIARANGIAFEGYLTRQDLEALLFLMK